jgi:hypothetical protein
MNLSQRKQLAFGMLPIGFGLLLTGSWLFVIAFTTPEYIWAVVCSLSGSFFLWLTWVLDSATLKWFLGQHKSKK